MPLDDPLLAKLSAGWPSADWREVGVLLAVSGGADSVALARGMAALAAEWPGRLVVAHFNHCLRGAESDADQAFVVALCDRHSLDCVTGTAEPAQLATAGEGLEAAARAARYEFLRQAAEARGARYVATAHTADDQTETVLHHILRGTGLAGLAGMGRTRALGPAVTLVRPLLDVRRQEVLEYLAAHQQSYRQDATNDDVRLTRNRIRHELLPLLAQDYSPGVVGALLRLSAVAGDAQRAIERAASELVERAVTFAGASRVSVHCRILTAEDRHLVREMFVTIWRRQAWPQQAMGYAEWNLLAEMTLPLDESAGASPGATAGSSSSAESSRKRMFPGAITAEKRDDWLVLEGGPRPIE